MKIFFDTEFTGLHQNTTLISIGLVSETGHEFYGVFDDYDKSQIDDWLTQNVIDNLDIDTDLCYPEAFCYRGDSQTISQRLENWLWRIGCDENNKAEFWSDCLSYDWMLFCQLFGHAFNIPKNAYYIPFDICTVFKLKGIDPDINRETFVTFDNEFAQKHNSLYDAHIIKLCYEKLTNG